EGPVEDVHQGGGDDVQGLARQVHGRVGQVLAMVVHHQRVGELDPEAATLLTGESVEFGDQFHAPVELEVGLEVVRTEADLVVAEVVVDDGIDALEAEQGGVQLDDDVE